VVLAEGSEGTCEWQFGCALAVAYDEWHGMAMLQHAATARHDEGEHHPTEGRARTHACNTPAAVQRLCCSSHAFREWNTNSSLLLLLLLLLLPPPPPPLLLLLLLTMMVVEMMMVMVSAAVVVAGGRRKRGTGQEEVAESDKRLACVDGKEEGNLQNCIAKGLHNVALPQHRTLPPPAVGVGVVKRARVARFGRGVCAGGYFTASLLLFYCFVTSILLRR
jgi:hypothetical protein